MRELTDKGGDPEIDLDYLRIMGLVRKLERPILVREGGGLK